MIPLHAHRIPRRDRYTPEQLAREADDQLGAATSEILALQSRLHIVRLQVGVTRTTLESLRQLFARPVTRSTRARKAG